jgi:putative component of membrane protein insertase Oxa1/YidC/SpoIIIJ protein YidD
MQRSKNRGLSVLIVFSLGISIYAQQIDFKPDLLIINKQLSEKLPDPYKRPYIYKDEPSLIKKINPVNILFGTTLYVYQNVFSRQISAKCLYTPSCSEFSKDAIREYGVLKGVFLSVDRVNRCGRLPSKDLKNYKKDPGTNRYPDPVSGYKRVKKYDGN